MSSLWIISLLLMVSSVATVTTREHKKPQNDSHRPRGNIPLTPAERLHHPRHRSHKTRSVFVPPIAFDSAQRWPQCTSIRTIRDQGSCNSCWAVSSSSVLADRLCIATGQDIPELISATQSVGCTRPSYSDKKNCDEGGNEANVYKLAAVNGVASGGLETGPRTGCVPYNTSRLRCENTCTNNNWQDPLPEDTTTHVIDAYWSGFNNDAQTQAEIDANVLKMQEEIFTNGPITVAIYGSTPSFSYDPAGPYDAPPPNKPLKDGHAMRVTGWNVTSSGIPYWIIANAWGVDAGKQGYYWIRLGKNVAGVEQYAGAPTVDVGKTISCSANTFCSAPIDQALRINITDPSAPIYLFQGNCLLEVSLQDGFILPNDNPVPIPKKIAGLVSGPITKYQYENGKLYIMNAAGEASANCESVPGSQKYVCDYGGTWNTVQIVSAVYNVASGFTAYLYDSGQPEWIAEIISPTLDTANGDFNGIYSPELFSSTAMKSVTAFLDIDGTKMFVVGKDASNKPLVGVLTYPTTEPKTFTVSSGRTTWVLSRQFRQSIINGWPYKPDAE